MNLTITCPSCQRPLRVPENLLGQTVKCPSCAHTFVAPENIEEQSPSPAPPRDDYVEKPLPSRHGAPEDEYDEDYEGTPRRRREKPGKVQAIAIMMLVGGILAAISSGLMLLYFGLVGVATMGVGLFCCLWPGPYYGVVMGIMAATRGIRLLGEKDSGVATPPSGIGVMMIINIINFDILNLVLGILVLVFLGDEDVKDYFRR